MTVTKTTNRWSDFGDGVTKEFGYDNIIFAASDLKVYLDGLQQTAGFTVTGVGDPAGGKVTFDVAPAGGAEVIRVRDVPATQEVDYEEAGKFPAEVHEKALDKLTVLMQQQAAEVARSLRLAPGDGGADLPELPAASARANRYIAFDGAGSPIMLPGTSEDVDVSDRLVTGSGGTKSISLSNLFGTVLTPQMFGAVGDGVADDTAAVSAAVAAAYAGGKQMYWPVGTYVTTSSVPNLHDVRHSGPGVIKRGSALWYVTPPNYDTINHVYAAASGGSATNDGLSASEPLSTFQGAIDVLEKWAPLVRGQWQIDLAAGQYARGRFPDEGLHAAYPIRIVGPAVSISGTAAFKMSFTGDSGNFSNGETITFSGGATATLTFVDNAPIRVLFADLVSGTPAANETITGGTSGATATVDYMSPTPLAKIKEGATQGAVGVLAFNTPLYVQDIEIEDYNGTSSSAGIRANFSDLFLRNVHLLDNFWGARQVNFGLLDVEGGFVYDCGYLNSDSGVGGGAGLQGLFHSKFAIGTQGAGNLLSGPAIKGCSMGVYGQEAATGHLDWVLCHDNDTGARLAVNSRLNVGGSSFKRNANSAMFGTQGCFFDPTDDTVFGTGADANGSVFSGGMASGASNLGITGINTANATEDATFKSAFPNTVVTSTSSANTIDSLTLKAMAFQGALLNGIAAKKIGLRVYGVLAGTAGTYKRLALRLGASSIVLLSLGGTDTGDFQAELELLFTGPSTQLGAARGLAMNFARTRTVSLTEDLSADTTLAFQAYVQNAADSITINGYEWYVRGV